MLYNVVLVSALQQHESAISIHMSLPSWTSLPLPSHLSRLSQSTGLSSLCYTTTSHKLSILHMIMYMHQCYVLNSSHPSLTSFSSPLLFTHSAVWQVSGRHQVSLGDDSDSTVAVYLSFSEPQLSHLWSGHPDKPILQGCLQSTWPGALGLRPTHPVFEELSVQSESRIPSYGRSRDNGFRQVGNI